MDMNSFSVLLVDDEPVFRYPLVRRLTKRHLTVEEANDGHEALHMIKTRKIDVVVLDVKMPGMDGLEVLRAIKADHNLIEVIMLSGHASMDAAIKGMQQGAFDYLMKPLDFDDLYFKLQDAYHKKHIQEQKIEKLQERGSFQGEIPS